MALVLGGLLVWLGQGLGAASAWRLMRMDRLEAEQLRGVALIGLGGLIGAAIAAGLVLAAQPWVGRAIRLTLDGRAVRAGVVGALVIIPISMLAGKASSEVWRALMSVDPPQVAHQTLRLLAGGPGASSADGSIPANGAVWWWLSVIGVVLAAPAIEELIYRGFVQTAVRRATESAPASLLITSGLFVAAHVRVADAHALPVLFVLSLGFGVLYERSGRLAAPMVAHAAFNAISILIVSVG